MQIIKSGCILFNKDKTKVALIYRDYANDYTFPKGHIEENENIKECAIRETEEEIKLKPLIFDDIYVSEEYNSNEGKIKVIYYIAFDYEISSNNSLDTHTLIWKDINEVGNLLTYESTKQMWEKVLKIVKE